MIKLSKHTIIKTVLIFLITYLIALVLWIQVKDYYGYALTLMASNVVAAFKDVRFDAIVQKNDIVEATFTPYRINYEILIDIPVKTSSFSFNTPLTFGIVAALYLFIQKKKRACAEAILILLVIHLLYVMTLEIKVLTEITMETGIETVSKLHIFVYQFLWAFIDNMVIRFEPFLIGFYLFVRFRK